MSTFDANGNRTSLGYPGGNTIENSYDSLNRLTNIVSGSGTTFANYTYAGIHQTNVLYGNGKNIASTFDDIGRLKTLDNSLKNYSFTYDNVGNITTDSHKNYTYDSLYRLTQASETNSGNTLENFQYDPMGNRTADKDSRYDTNILNQYTNLSGSTLSGALSYDNNGNLSENTKFRFVYDYKNRLVKVVEKAHSGMITETSSGTITGSGTDTSSGTVNSGSGILTDSGSTTGTGTLSDSGSLTGTGIDTSSGTLTGTGTDTSSGTTAGTGIIDTGSGIINTNSGTLTDSGSTTGTGTDTSSGTTTTDSGTVTPPADTGSGTITDSGATAFIYNVSVASEIITASGTDSNMIPERIIVEFSYDVLGRRISKQTLNSTILYVYSGEQAIQETETINGVEKTKEYVYGNGGVDDVIASIQDNTVYFYHKDQVGSIVGITDGSGNTVSTYSYDTFGKASLISGVEIGNGRLFTGREYDGETNLYYYRARYYDANLGRFISRDPIDTSDDVNLYGYVKNNPVNSVDPSGLSSKAIIALFRKSGTEMMDFRSKNESSWLNNDLSPTLNNYYMESELHGLGRGGEYDLAYGGSDISNKYDLNQDGYVVFDGEQMNLGEISNVLTALNAQRLGFSQEHLENSAMITVKLGLGNGVEGEMADRKLYDYGYILGSIEGNSGELTNQQIIRGIKKAVKARKDYNLARNK